MDSFRDLAKGHKPTPVGLDAAADEKLADAKTLHGLRRHDSAYYLCGYSIELALKARICRTLDWPVFLNKYKDIKTHNLDVLLDFTALASIFNGKHFAEWSKALEWSPELRYMPLQTVSAQDATDLIEAADVILRALR